MSVPKSAAPNTFPGTLPNINTPLLGNEGGPSPPWYRIFQAFFSRTGSGSGIDGALLTQDDRDSQLFNAMQSHGHAAPLPFDVTPGASPWVYQAPFPGTVNIQGGTVSKVEFSRDGGVSYITLAAQLAPVFTGDYLKVTYSVVPTVTMIGA